MQKLKEKNFKEKVKDETARLAHKSGSAHLLT